MLMSGMGFGCSKREANIFWWGKIRISERVRALEKLFMRKLLQSLKQMLGSENV